MYVFCLMNATAEIEIWSCSPLVMTGIPWELDELPRQMHPTVIGKMVCPLGPFLCHLCSFSNRSLSPYCLSQWVTFMALRLRAGGTAMVSPLPSLHRLIPSLSVPKGHGDRHRLMLRVPSRKDQALPLSNSNSNNG